MSILSLVNKLCDFPHTYHTHIMIVNHMFNVNCGHLPCSYVVVGQSKSSVAGSNG